MHFADSKKVRKQLVESNNSGRCVYIDMKVVELDPDSIQLVAQDALTNFHSGIKSNETRKPMLRNLSTFLNIVCKKILKGNLMERAQEFVDLAKNDQQKTLAIVSQYVQHLKNRTCLDKANPEYLNPSTIPNKIKPIKKLLDMNGVGIAWKRIYTMYPELNNIHKGRGYTRDEIKILLEHADNLALEFVILAESSGGFRVGAWNDITWDCICPVYKVGDDYKLEPDSNGTIVCAVMKIYKGTSQEYETLISIEAWNKLAEYKIFWISKVNRQPQNNDPVILQRFKRPVPISDKAIRSRIEKIRNRTGIISPLTEGKRRHDIPVTHGFRRYYDKIMMECNQKSSTLSSLVIKERLLGHGGIVKTDKNYYWTNIIDMIPQYLQAMPEIMIDDKYRMQIKLEQEKAKTIELERQNQQNTDALGKLRELEVKIRRMEKYQKTED